MSKCVCLLHINTIFDIYLIYHMKKYEQNKNSNKILKYLRICWVAIGAFVVFEVFDRFVDVVLPGDGSRFILLEQKLFYKMLRTKMFFADIFNEDTIRVILSFQIITLCFVAKIWKKLNILTEFEELLMLSIQIAYC